MNSLVLSFIAVFDFNSVSNYIFKPMWMGTQTKYGAADILTVHA